MKEGKIEEGIRVWVRRKCDVGWRSCLSARRPLAPTPQKRKTHHNHGPRCVCDIGFGRRLGFGTTLYPFSSACRVLSELLGGGKLFGGELLLITKACSSSRRLVACDAVMCC